LPAPKLGAAKASLVLGVASYPLLCAFGLGAFTALLAMALGILALVRAARAHSREGRGAAIGGILLGASCIGLVTVLTLPNLMASRMSANEAAAIGDIRTVIMAEVEYSKANGELYDTLECLAAPARCIPGFEATRPGFLAPELATARVKMGYTRTFHAGPAPEGGRPKGVSPTSMTSYAYVALPASPLSSGVRSFCGDVTGRLCANTDGSTPVVVGGQCAPSCPDLR
jgi:hypothetical protein